MAEKIWLKRYPDFFSMRVAIKLSVQVFLQQLFALFGVWQLAQLDVSQKNPINIKIEKLSSCRARREEHFGTVFSTWHRMAEKIYPRNPR
jgi:hypothetical protein